MNCSTPGLPVHHQLWSLLKLNSIESLMPFYFGEERSEDCGICDVCNQHRDNHETELDDKKCRQIILDFLSDGQRHHLTELNELHLPEQHLSQALQYLVSEEIVTTESSWIYVEKANS